MPGRGEVGRGEVGLWGSKGIDGACCTRKGVCNRLFRKLQVFKWLQLQTWLLQREPGDSQWRRSFSLNSATKGARSICSLRVDFRLQRWLGAYSARCIQRSLCKLKGEPQNSSKARRGRKLA